MNNEKLMELKLKTLRKFQAKYPTSHVGGSIGLMLHGVDLKRNLCLSDLDITVDESNEDLEALHDEMIKRSIDSDFDIGVITYHDNGNAYTKMDIRINPEPSFEHITYMGLNYNVSKLRDILFWKQKYADKGYQKHKNDLICIKTGIRPKDELDLNLSLPFFLSFK